MKRYLKITFAEGQLPVSCVQILYILRFTQANGCLVYSNIPETGHKSLNTCSYSHPIPVLTHILLANKFFSVSPMFFHFFLTPQIPTVSSTQRIYSEYLVCTKEALGNAALFSKFELRELYKQFYTGLSLWRHPVIAVNHSTKTVKSGIRLLKATYTVFQTGENRTKHCKMVPSITSIMYPTTATVPWSQTADDRNSKLASLRILTCPSLADCLFRAEIIIHR